VLAVASHDIPRTKASFDAWQAEDKDAKRREQLAAKTEARKRSKNAAKARKRRKK
jgi:hypothetical protein